MDRFSLNMKLERRLLFSLDPLHPNILISANIPSLAFQLDVDNMRYFIQAQGYQTGSGYWIGIQIVFKQNKNKTQYAKDLRNSCHKDSSLKITIESKK